MSRSWQVATAVTALAGVGLTGYLVGVSGTGDAAAVRTIQLDIEDELGTGTPRELEVTDRSPTPASDRDRDIVPAELSPVSLDSPDDTPTAGTATTSSGTGDSATTTGDQEDSPDTVDSPTSIDS